jgi:uncharacterized protein
MNLLANHHQNVIVQILASGAAFGIVHSFWGIRGGMAAVIAAVRSTTLLGLALAVVFILAGRIVFPCVVAHFTINLVLEPLQREQLLEEATDLTCAIDEMNF